jgi:hypothetical protein
MARKIENWNTGVFRDLNQYIHGNRNSSARELVIIVAATIDNGLAHLIEMKLVEDKKEIESFLGLSDDGRAPVGSLGSRIQLSYLLGLISKRETIIFGAIKSIRNKFAHKVNMTFLNINVVNELKKIISNFKNLEIEINGTSFKGNELITKISENASSGESLLYKLLIYYHRIFDLRINTFRSKNKLIEYGKQ